MYRFLAATFAFTFAMVAVLALNPGQKPASAQEAADIGVVEVQLIMREASAAKSIQAQIEQTRSGYEAAMLEEETRLRELEQELVRQRSLLAPEAFAEKRRDFETQVAQHKRGVRDRRRALDQAYGAGVRQIQLIVTEIIGEIAKERGLIVVLPASQVLYAERSLVITEEVLGNLNARLPDVALEFPAN